MNHGVGALREWPFIFLMSNVHHLKINDISIQNLPYQTENTEISEHNLDLLTNKHRPGCGCRK